MGILNKHWEDETAGKSAIENMNFEPDREWESFTFTLKGRNYAQVFNIKINISDDTVYNQTFVLGEKQRSLTETYKLLPEAKNKSVSITGEVCAAWMRPDLVFVPGGKYLPNLFTNRAASGTVDVVGNYKEGTILSKEVATWDDETGLYSYIDRLFLESDRTWKRCEIKVEGHQNQITTCRLALIVNGELPGYLPETFTLDGSQSKVITFNNIEQKAPLLVTGYLQNSAIVTGAGAKVTLTGFYEEKKVFANV